MSVLLNLGLRLRTDGNGFRQFVHAFVIDDRRQLVVENRTVINEFLTDRTALFADHIGKNWFKPTHFRNVRCDLVMRKTVFDERL
ncbi:hypothetical protein D3C75_1211850 [compost metagenome]